MNRETKHDLLAQLGEELLREFEETKKTEVSAEFDRKCRDMLCKKKEKPVCQFVWWTAQAAVAAFALVGVMTVAMLSVGILRNGFFRFAAAQLAQEQEETVTEFEQISYAQADNMAMSVYYDGNENYQILWSNEFGQWVYDFRAQGIDEALFRDLGNQLVAAEE